MVLPLLARRNSPLAEASNIKNKLNYTKVIQLFVSEKNHSNHSRQTLLPNFQVSTLIQRALINNYLFQLV